MSWIAKRWEKGAAVWAEKALSFGKAVKNDEARSQNQENQKGETFEAHRLCGMREIKSATKGETIGIDALFQEGVQEGIEGLFAQAGREAEAEVKAEFLKFSFMKLLSEAFAHIG